MGTTELTTTRSECQPHACHVCFVKIYWDELCSGSPQYLCSFTTKIRETVTSRSFLLSGFRFENKFSDAEASITMNKRFTAR